MASCDYDDANFIPINYNNFLKSVELRSRATIILKKPQRFLGSHLSFTNSGSSCLTAGHSTLSSLTGKKSL